MKDASLILTEIELCSWLAHAAPGDILEYYRGFLAIDRAPDAHSLSELQRRELVRLASRALWMSEEGWAHLVQRRHGPGDHSYLLVARPKHGSVAAALSSRPLDEPASG